MRIVGGISIWPSEVKFGSLSLQRRKKESERESLREREMVLSETHRAREP